MVVILYFDSVSVSRAVEIYKWVIKPLDAWFTCVAMMSHAVSVRSQIISALCHSHCVAYKYAMVTTPYLSITKIGFW